MKKGTVFVAACFIRGMPVRLNGWSSVLMVLAVIRINRILPGFPNKNLPSIRTMPFWPSIGPVMGRMPVKKLELDECMKYLTFVVNYCKNELKAEKLFIYSVSFGGYLTLKYMAEIGNPFTRVALRCPGIQMYKLMLNNFDEEDLKKLAKGKEISIGFDRKMKVDQKLLDDLKKSDITKYEYFDWADDMLILHGTEDTMAPIEDSREFAENNVIEFIPVEGADHPFQDQKLMDYAIHTIISFFSDGPGD